MSYRHLARVRAAAEEAMRAVTGTPLATAAAAGVFTPDEAALLAPCSDRLRAGLAVLLSHLPPAAAAADREAIVLAAPRRRQAVGPALAGRRCGR